MGSKTGISWTDSTWNPWRGCHKVSPGCANCYMFRDMQRYGNDPNVVVRSKTTFRDPVKWKEPRRIFVCSWSDFFIEEADPWRNEAWQIIRDTKHTFQLCTKRPERIKDCLPNDWGKGYPNVWLGVTGENQTMFDRRVEILLSIPAKIHWVSVEPMLEPIFSDYRKDRALDWVVIGGESGNNARPFDLVWIIPFMKKPYKLFVKQVGSNPVGLVLRDKHGANPVEWETRYRIQEFPEG